MYYGLCNYYRFDCADMFRMAVRRTRKRFKTLFIVRCELVSYMKKTCLKSLAVGCGGLFKNIVNCINTTDGIICYSSVLKSECICQSYMVF